MNQFAAVEEFMLAMKQDVPALPCHPPLKTISLRVRLVDEEAYELLRALWRAESIANSENTPHATKLLNLVNIGDAVADCVYVIVGTALAFGLPIERIFEIVRAANMAKLGGPVREDGKQLKPEGWEPPEPKITDLITGMWANAAPRPVEQHDGVDFEGPLDGPS